MFPVTHHGQRLLAVKHAVDVTDDFAHVIVGESTSPACADTISAVGQNEWDDGNVPLGLHAHVVIIVVFEQVVIHSREKQPSQRTSVRARERHEHTKI